MPKDPAFLFYPGDASNDTQFMNRLERGAYFDLMKAQRLFGGYTAVQIRKVLGNDFEEVWPALELVLQFDGEKYFIGWLAESISKREDYSKKQSERIKKRWNKDGNTAVLPKKENEIEIENEIELGKGSAEGKTISEPEKKTSKGTVAQNVPELITVQEFWAECTSDEKSIALGWTKEIAYEQALSWYDSMKSKGWKVGKAATPMRDWQAASRTGIRNAVEWGKVKPPSSQQLPMPHKSFSTRVTPL